VVAKRGTGATPIASAITPRIAVNFFSEWVMVL